MSYQPRRTTRFEYATDLIEYVESRQCKTCDHRWETECGTICAPAGGAAYCEDPIDFWDEVEPDVVVCRRGPEVTS